MVSGQFRRIPTRPAPSIDQVTVELSFLDAAFPASFELRSLWQAAQGRAAACNAGVREAVGRRIILLDDDLDPAPHCLAAHLAANPNGSRIGIVAGGFDEGFRLYGHEDYEFALRLAGAGATFRFSRDALAVQHYAKTLPQLANDIMERRHLGNVDYAGPSSWSVGRTACRLQR